MISPDHAPTEAVSAALRAVSDTDEGRSACAQLGADLHVVLDDGRVTVLATPQPAGDPMRIETSAAALADLWLGRCTFQQAVIARRLLVKGPVRKARQLGPVLAVAGGRYRASLGSAPAAAESATAEPAVEATR